MTPERWKQIEDLYHSAVESGEEARAALFAQASPEIRDTVMGMLTQQSAGEIGRASCRERVLLGV